jgi:dihydroorotate dehydrogenase electron transfer subunit
MKRVNIRSVKQGTGELVELYLESGQTAGKLLCPQNLIPKPGQYSLAHDGSDAPLPVPVFSAGSVPGGFLAAPPLPSTWHPGMKLALRGPLGHGFSLPESARCVGLLALGTTVARLRPLLATALELNAAVVLVSDLKLTDFPPEVEIRPLSGLKDIIMWADFLAIDILRESLPGLQEMLGINEQVKVTVEAQVLVATPMPCGGIAECGVCAVSARRGWKIACKDGPVFSLQELV